MDKIPVDEIINQISELDAQRTKLLEITEPHILNGFKFEMSFLGKVVLDAQEGIVRVGDYNTLDGDMYFAKWALDNGYEIFMPQIVKKDFGWCKVTLQEPLEEVFEPTLPEEEVWDMIKIDWGQETVDMLQEKGVFGFGHSNAGRAGGKVRIVDWMGGPCRVGNMLVDWKGNILIPEIEPTDYIIDIKEM